MKITISAFLLMCVDLKEVACNRFRAEKGLRGTGLEPTRTLLAELEDQLDYEHSPDAQAQVREFEEEMKHTFQALPKNTRDAVSAPAARYMLHRLYLQRHGWQIKGLETGGGAWDADSPISAMGDRVPAAMRTLLEQRLGSFGMTLHEVALLATIMDNMFRADVTDRLRIVYSAYGLSENGTVGHATAFQAMMGYISSFIIGSRLEQLTAEEVLASVSQLNARFPRVGKAKELLEKIIEEVAGSNGRYDFGVMTSILLTFGQQIGSLEDSECQVMKNKLIGREEQPGSGRVRLGDFYDDTDWTIHFTEDVQYLRSQGILDESNPKDPKVMIPNYLASPSNCVSPSGYYEICCFDQCEVLMDKIETHLAAPLASPEKIAAFVSTLESDSQLANRTLSPQLLDLLDEVAQHHGGQVPIHGRLFSQWMHQAYPRECNHPHLVTQDRFSSIPSNADQKTMEKYMELAKIAKAEAEVKGNGLTMAGVWTMHEELVDSATLQKHKKTGMHDVFALGTIGLVGMTLVKLLAGDMKESKGSKLL